MLVADEAKDDQAINVTEQLLKEGNICLTKARKKTSGKYSSLIDSENKKLESIKQHRKEQQKYNLRLGKGDNQ